MKSETEIDTTTAPCMAVRTMCDVFGTGKLFSPRAPVRGSQWLPPPPDLEDMTGRQLVICGAMPVLCHRSVAVPAGLSLLREIGHVLSPEIHAYRDDADRLRQLQHFTAAGYRVVVQHVHPPDELEPGACWVEPGLLAWLNNKAQLGQLVSAAHRPRSELARPDRLAGYHGALPVVVKAATNFSTGGCHDVRLCCDEAELHAAHDLFRDCDEIVFEEFLELRTVLNIQFTIGQDGLARYLGASEQLMTPDLKPAGNWLSPEHAPPQDALAAVAAVVWQAAKRGYTGFVGVDVGLLPDGSGRLLDLNFRLNASTTPLLLIAHLRSTMNQPCAFYGSMAYTGDFSAMLRAALRAANQGLMLPVSFFDPHSAGAPGVLPCTSVMIAAENREHLTERRTQLAGLGFVT